MHVGREALVGGDLLQQPRELLPLVRVERTEQDILVLARDQADFRQRPPTLVGEPQGVAAAVSRIFGAHDQAALFEVVDERDRATGKHAQPLGERALGHALGRGEHAQRTCVLRLQPDARQAFGEAHRRVGADLRDEEGGPASDVLRLHDRMVAFRIILVMNDSPKNRIVHPSPPLSALAIVHALLFGCGLAAFAILSSGGRIPSPFAPGSVRYLIGHATALRWQAFFLFACSVPLGLFTAVVVSRLHFLGIRAAGVHIALFGGILASLALAASGLAAWVLSEPAIGDSASALQLASFAAGGPAFAVGFGLLAAGVSVTGGLSANLPRWTMWLGLFVAAAGELSTLSQVVARSLGARPRVSMWPHAMGWRE